MLSLLPDVQGLRVLDAGCGPGALTEIIVNLGASVMAINANAKMVAHARDRLGDRAEIHLARVWRTGGGALLPPTVG